jgi:hypothetical protein
MTLSTSDQTIDARRTAGRHRTRLRCRPLRARQALFPLAMSSILRSLMVDRESVVSDVRWGSCERAVGSCGAVLSTKPAFGRVRDGWPRPPAAAI